jgi:hypothetical protein
MAFGSFTRRQRIETEISGVKIGGPNEREIPICRISTFFGRCREGKRLNTSQYPPPSLREKLVVAGIPESEHTAELLAARVPADFSPQAFQGLSVDMMAELLLYLIAKGLVTLPIA